MSIGDAPPRAAGWSRRPLPARPRRRHVHAARPGTARAVRPRNRVIVGYGFWIFLLSDIVMFSCFFAAHAVLQAPPPAGRPAASCSTCRGSRSRRPACCFELHLRPAAVATQARSQLWTQVGLLVTGLLGLAFVLLEVQEFAAHGPARRTARAQRLPVVLFRPGRLHGLHVSRGLLWLGTMMAQVFVKGFRADILRRLMCFNLFWHALDIIWVALFTIVYLMGKWR